jgi:hypothetical protein
MSKGESMKPGDDAPIQLWVSVDTTLARTTPPRHATLFISGVQSGYSRSSAATHDTKSLCSSVFLSTTTTLRRRSFWRSARPFAGVPCSQPPSHPSTPTTTRHHETARRQGSELGAAAQRAAADTGTCARWGGARNVGNFIARNKKTGAFLLRARGILEASRAAAAPRSP